MVSSMEPTSVMSTRAVPTLRAVPNSCSSCRAITGNRPTLRRAHTTASTQNRQDRVFQSKYPA